MTPTGAPFETPNVLVIHESGLLTPPTTRASAPGQQVQDHAQHPSLTLEQFSQLLYDQDIYQSRARSGGSKPVHTPN
jgi:hypothetical protein